MRWFVEVSRVGENSSDEKYCVEAKQWQAALQEARKLRGDSGPLSKFSIELLDDGYRAVDPKQKLKFIVAKAPADAELSTEGAPRPNGGSSAPSNAPAASQTAVPVAAAAPAPVPGPAPAPAITAVAVPVPVVVPPAAAASAPAPAPVVIPPVAAIAPTPAPAAVAASVALPSPSATTLAESPSAKAAVSHAEPYAGVLASNLSPHAPSGAAAAAPAVNGHAAPVHTTKTPSAFPPRPVAGKSPSAKPPAGITVPADAIPAAPALPKDVGPAVPAANFTQPSPVMEMPPPATVFRRRQEEPTVETPITYREVAYAVAPGVTRGSVEVLLWAAFRDLSRELADRSGQKFIQLAVFDHKFDKKPERPPLGTLAWKDWRGNPVLSFPLFDGTGPARASVPAPSIKPVAVVKITSPLPPVPSEAAAALAAQAVLPPAAAVAPAPVAVTEAIPPAPMPAGTPAATLPIALTPIPSEAIPLTREKMPSQPSASRSSRPRMAAVRRRAGEDLIGELFESLHDLHFMQAVADGAEFMLATIESIVPCEGVLIHVFDINTRQFVVVRAKGPGALQVILHQTSDADPFIVGLMRRPSSMVVHDTSEDARVLGPRWDALGVKPQRVLCGPVRQGGRYLGLIEMANPLGDAPFHQTEQNAIDYACEQFAEFLANRPIVLDADVILRR